MAEEGMTIRFEDREFNAAIDELANTSRRSDFEVLTGQAIQLIRRLAFLTRLAKKPPAGGEYRGKGRARSGWWPSWQGLGVFGVPRGVKIALLALGEGSFVDGRHRVGKPFVEMTNSVTFIETLDEKDNILTRATSERFADMIRAVRDRYRRDMARKSGR